MSRILDIALNSMWAMEQEALERLLSIAAREHTVDTEALAAYRAKSLENAERTTTRDGVAIMNIEGALFPKANLMTDISGATSYDILRRDLQAVIDQGAKTLLLNVDSPGGAVNGMSEFAQALAEAREKLNIVAYVRGTMASAALVVGSAAHRIVVNDMAEVGSLGVMMTISKAAEDPKGGKTFQFISSQSPMKNADPGTDAGAKAYQARVDSMAAVAIETVARNRGVDTQTALKNFGQGGIFIGKEAVQAGLADAVGTFESVLAELASGKGSSGSGSQNKGTTISMADANDTTTAEAPAAPAVAAAAPAPAPVAPAPAVDVNTAVAQALAAERVRTSGLREIADAHGVDAATLNEAINGGTDVATFALSVARKSAEANKGRVEALRRDETEASTVRPSDAPAAEATQADAAAKLAAEIAGHLPDDVKAKA